MVNADHQTVVHSKLLLAMDCAAQELLPYSYQMMKVGLGFAKELMAEPMILAAQLR
jgi:hypothetical protein